MTTAPPEAPDVHELTRLALAASARNDSESAIAYLKQASAADQSAAVPHFLLGAEYAQIGIVDRAVDEFTRAIDADPALATARFQLGLLHLTAGRVRDAVQAWKPLEQLGSQDPLNLFQAGMTALANDELARARELLTRGLAANTDNPALSRDMERVISRIDEAAAAPAGGNQHVLVSAYKDR
jgi:tetratricopeptide (TPR) repeat protein